jgi:biotin carboxyl carrier protein
MKAYVNNKEYNVTEKGIEPLTFEVNGKQVIIDAYTPRKGAMHILYGSQSYNAELVSYNEEEKIITIKVNNSRYDIKLKDETDDLLEKLGIGKLAHKLQQIKAPMPGLVLDVKVKPGDTVNKGDSLLILEAMKMENIIKATGPAVIKKINVSKGTAVEKNQVLIEME